MNTNKMVAFQNYDLSSTVRVSEQKLHISDELQILS